MARLEFEIAGTLSEEMDRLRLLCFSTGSATTTSRDEFDSRSFHLAIRIDSLVAAYGRLTPGPSAVFESWTKGFAKIPTGPEVADLGRCLVSPSYRGLGLFALVCLEGMIYAAERGFSKIVGAMVSGQKHASTLYAIGFQDSGPVVDGRDSVGHYYEAIQPLVADCRETGKWMSRRAEVLEELRSKGIGSPARGRG